MNHLLMDKASKNFSNELGLCHRKIMPYWPSANSETERFMSTLNKSVDTAHLFTFLRNYQATPHVPTGQIPAILMFAHNTATKLPEIAEKKQNDKELREKDHAAKEMTKRENKMKVILSTLEKLL